VELQLYLDYVLAVASACPLAMADRRPRQRGNALIAAATAAAVTAGYDGISRAAAARLADLLLECTPSLRSRRTAGAWARALMDHPSHLGP